MSYIAQLSAITFLIDFLFGVMFGIVGSASFASRREERGYSLLHAPPDLISSGARVLHGIHQRGNAWVADVRRGTAQHDDAGPGGGDEPGSHGQAPER